MAGTKAGAAKASKTIKERYGEHYYGLIGYIGGKNGTTGGFAAGEEGRERARIHGRIGGMKSKRGKKYDIQNTSETITVS